MRARSTIIVMLVLSLLFGMQVQQVAYGLKMDCPVVKCVRDCCPVLDCCAPARHEMPQPTSVPAPQRDHFGLAAQVWQSAPLLYLLPRAVTKQTIAEKLIESHAPSPLAASGICLI